MIKVLLTGHNYRYQTFNLLKVFYSSEDIEFVNEKTLVDNQSLFIESNLYYDEHVYKASTRIFKNNDLISSHTISNIQDIDIMKNDEEKKIKLGIKQSIFEAVSKISEVKAPWGVLTGIRPTKIVHKLIDKNCNNEQIAKILRESYRVSHEKIVLLLDIVNRQRKYMGPLNDNKFSLYVSIPFCPTRCLYCSFPSNPIDKFKHEVNDYVNTLIYEMKKLSEILKDKTIHTVYIGGGTPTAIPETSLKKIIDGVYNNYDRKHIKEFTVEAGRPDTIGNSMLRMLKEADVDRISINPQTMNQDTLSSIGRNHSPQDIINAFHLAKEIGFKTINMDLIVGLPGEDMPDIDKTMKEIIKMNPDNLTVHTMAVKKASILKEQIKQYALTKQGDIERMTKTTLKYSKEMGMNPYYLYRQKNILGNLENIGYARPGKECIYNILIMEERETILAVGAGGISKVYFPYNNKIERVPNVKNLNAYRMRVDEMLERKKKVLIGS